VIDIYKDKIKPEKNFVDYAVFVSFFPLLVAFPLNVPHTCYRKSSANASSITTRP
jgi:D-alanyl-lipoteichoic acid acyltransferase DltB (MBOAT superfamily)